MEAIMITYRVDQELEALGLRWQRGNEIVDFSTGWTFSLTLSLPTSSTAVLTKTTGITGAATYPNITIDWATSDFTGLGSVDPGTEYKVLLKARRTADSKDSYYRPDGSLRIRIITAVA
jgi:hypothetical protein